MPFTLVHPAFVLPFYNRIKAYCIPVALIAGSLVPDYDIVFRFTETRFHLFSFSLYSVFGVLLPLALLTVFFYTYVLRDFMLEKCPPLIQQIAMNIPSFVVKNSLRTYMLLIANIVAAIYFHLFLDLISHYDAWTVMQFVKMYMTDNESILQMAYWGSIYLPQLIFMIIGLYILFINFHQYLEYFNVKDFLDKKLWVYYALAFIITMIKVWLSGGIQKEYGIDVIIIALFGGFTLAFAILASIFRLKKSLT